MLHVVINMISPVYSKYPSTVMQSKYPSMHFLWCEQKTYFALETLWFAQKTYEEKVAQKV